MKQDLQEQLIENENFLPSPEGKVSGPLAADCVRLWHVKHAVVSENERDGTRVSRNQDEPRTSTSRPGIFKLLFLGNL